VSGSTSGRSTTATVAAARASAVDASSRTGVKSIPRGSSRADAPSSEISIRAPPSAIEARSDAITSAAPRRGENVAPMDPWQPLATMTVASMGAAPPTRARKVSARESCRIAAPTESMAFAAASIASVSVCAVRRWRGATRGSTSMSTIETYASARSLPQASSSATERRRPARAVGRTRDGEGAEGLEVDEELASFALADGDQCGDACGEFIGWYGTLRVVVQAPRPSAVGGAP
jgi:hypothetical protein